MKISELVDELELELDVRGDVEVYVAVWTTNDEMYELPSLHFDGDFLIIK